MKVLGIGDNVCDKYLHLKQMFPGGQTLNFSVYAKLLGKDSAYIGVFGTDEVAKHIQNTLNKLKIDYKKCRIIPGENGYAKVNLVNGDRVFLGSNKGGVLRENPIILDEKDLEYIKDFSLIHTSNNSYFDDQLYKIYDLGIPISYDFSLQWKDEERLKRVSKYLTYGFLSCGNLPEEEVKNICRKIHSLGCKIIVATRGSLGAFIYDGKDFFLQPPKLVEAVDTLGAGDSFATAFLLHLTEAYEINSKKMKNDREFFLKNLKIAMEKGAEFASKTCKIYGAFGYGKEISE
ncbi:MULTISPECIES: fructoselysine 6-kinase [Fusobacterium]|uniref:fructoselysine 6-kinase n=1 Tax=Fusobacterium TaxID=848 RepID=UPI00198144E1|nr:MULTISPECIES: fructoselysine 6-kinase [Fusobacterium]